MPVTPIDEERRIALAESVERVTRSKHEVAMRLVNWLQVDGLHHQISLEDIERLAQPGKREEFIRKIVAELLVVLRPK